MTVTVLLVAGDSSASSHASVSSSIAVAMGHPDWQARLAEAVTIRARESAVRLGLELAPGAPRNDRFVPLAAVVPTAH